MVSDSEQLYTDAIRSYMARTLFVVCWADWCDRFGEHTPGGAELMSAAPDTPKEAFDGADKFIADLERANGVSLFELFQRALAVVEVPIEDVEPNDDDHWVREFAYGLVMPALGHGVGWDDDYPEFEIELPDCHFTYYELSEADYPIPAGADDDEDNEVRVMEKEEAVRIASLWGSYMRAGDPGICMYGLSTTGKVQSQAHRQELLHYIDEHCLKQPDDPDRQNDPEDLEELRRLRRYIKTVAVEEIK